MRTRFLTPDYFTTNQTLEFLRLPLSPLPSSLNHQLFSSFDNLLRFCDDFSDTSVSLQLESLPIGDALSKFYSDVLPDTIDFDYGDVQVSEKDTDIYYENKAAQNCLASGSETLESRFAGERSKDAVGDKNGNEAVIIQFETPELTQHLENVYMPEKEEFQLLPEVQECDNYLETLNLVPTDPCAFDIIDQVNSAESICLDYDMTLKSQLSDEADLLPNNILPCGMLPLLEVEEVEPSVCLEDEWHSLFDAIEEQHSACDIDLELCCKDLLVSADIDIVEQISDSHSSKLPLEFCIPSLNLVLDIDLLQVIETPYIEKNTESVGAYSIPLVNPFLFEEIMMLDPASLDIFEVQAICQATDETELCNMFHGDTPSESFGELIVSCELAIINDTFTSLSVPDLVDDEKIWSLHAIIDNILTELEPLPLSTSDDIYLDWNLLGRGEYSDDVSAVIEKVFSDIETYTTGSGLTFDDDSMQVSDLLSDDTSVVLNIRESKVTMPSEVCSTVKLQNDEVASRELPDEECQVIENIRDLTNDDFEKLASGKSSDDDDDCQIIENDGICDGDFHKLVPSVDSMPQFNDLDFFLNPKKATGGMRTGHKVNPLDAKSLLSRGTLQKAIASSSTIQMQQFDIQWHTLILPANINFLIDNFRRSYLKILRDDVQLSNTGFPVTNSNDMNLLKLSEEKLMDHLSKASQPKSFTGHVDDSCFDFVALCAIKRMTWCLCFFGIYSLHHLICKLFQGQDTLKSRLSFLYPVIEDAYRVVDKEVTKSHPSLATIKDLLLQNDTRNGKVLILAQQVLWEPLKRLLTSMGLSFSELDYSMHDNQPNPDYNFFAGLKDRIQTKCLLAPHECISSSILMQKFDIIVEYGGPCGFSKLSAHSREYIGPQTLHFLKVELDDVAKAMCDGVVCSSDNSDAVNLEALLHFGPIKERCYQVPFKASGGTKSCSMAVPVCGIAQESEQGHPLSFQDMPIIVNTQNFDKEMIISRRSTYQKVLNMEKRGVQVVERDLILRVDMILNTTTCLVWYDCNNIGKKATTEDEGASSVPLCIENIAANVLTSLSFAFTTCILIFEGDCNFHGSVMESADELYAAAASLGTYLQIFYSSSLELTDEIILNYIGHCKNTNKGSLSTLPDSETLAESFLSKFPSMNPLSAHAIVSSVGKLMDFFEMTVESRAHRLREYHVSDESINLFTALCKYGEREESKSGVTDCSSSVSSPPDSGNFVCRINSEDRKRKYIASSSDADFKWSRPSEKCVDDRLTEQGMLGPSDSKVCKSPGVCLQEKLPDFMLDEELFFEGDVLDTGIHVDTSNAWGEKNITEEPKVPTMEDIFAQSTLLVNDGISSQHKSGQHKSGRANNKYDESSRVILQDLHKDFVGEAVDFYDKSLFDEDFQIDEESIKHSPMISETAKYAPRYNRTARKLSFGNDSDQNIPLADEMNISCILDDNQQWRGDSDFNSVKYNWSNINSKAQERQGQPGRSMLENSMQSFKAQERQGQPGRSMLENSMQSFKAQERQEQPGRIMLENSMQNFSDQFSKGKNASHYGETPLSKAVHSEQLQQGSPWTIEFLNRIKEKRKLRQHYPPYASVLRTGYQGNITKATTRRSPTILEYYKYQSGSTPRKVTGQKTQKKHDQLRSEKNPSEFRPICTPIDKRARRSLSFATSGTGSQTKLVWGDKNTCSQDNRFPSRVMR